MEINAQLNNLRISPRKVRLVADLIRGKQVETALNTLSFCVKKGSLPLKKLLLSAVANAKNNFALSQKELFIFQIKVDEGQKLKRWRARARGRAGRIEKKTSKITLILKSRDSADVNLVKGQKEKIKTKKENQGQESPDSVSLNQKKKRKVIKNKNFKQVKTSKPKSKGGGLSQKVFRRKSV